MKLFECQNCGQPLYFENTRCESCGLRLGYLPEQETITALQEADGAWRALAVPAGRYRFCANAQHDVCNWLVSADSAEAFCAACRHNRTIPDLSQSREPAALAQDRSRQAPAVLHAAAAAPAADHQDRGSRTGWRSISSSDPTDAPAGHSPVMTGHDNGLITINLAEADDAERERQRSQMGEPYRTLLGHFRHEIAHYYWDRLVADSPASRSSARLFGDERAGLCARRCNALRQRPAARLAGALRHRLCQRASVGGFRRDLGALFPHGRHAGDRERLRAAACGRRSPRAPTWRRRSTSIPIIAEMDRIIDAWLPLTFAVNSINRSMGQPDLYPFVLAPPVILKLAFIHERIHARSSPRPRDSGNNALRAVVAGLKRPVGSPQSTS